MEEINLKETVPAQLAGARLDQVSAQLFSGYSRSRLQMWIKSGALKVDGIALKPRAKLLGGELIEIQARVESCGEWQAQPMDLDIVYEDDDILVLNKPAGLVVHPAAGHADGTLLNALLYHVPSLEMVPRAGIVHRLDKDTTGLMVVAKNLVAHTHLVNQLQTRSMGREYEAITIGVMTGGSCIDQPIGRHPVHRKRMAVTPTGKSSKTHCQVIKRYRGHTHVRLKLESGRTHQIRVHLSHIRYPIVGDVTYAGRSKIPKAADPAFIDFLRAFQRQALHAKRLQLVHPGTGKVVSWEVPLPDDMQRLLGLLEEDMLEHEGAPGI